MGDCDHKTEDNLSDATRGVRAYFGCGYPSETWGGCSIPSTGASGGITATLLILESSSTRFTKEP